MLEHRKEQKVRLQLDLSPSQMDKFDALVTTCDFSTRKELFNAAMTLFNWAVLEAEKGRRIASYDEGADQVEKLLFPALESAADKAVRRQSSASGEASRQRRQFGVVSGDLVPTT